MSLMDTLLRACGQFDSRGLRYSTAHLQKIRSEIFKKPIRDIARYADEITVSTCNQSNLNDEILNTLVIYEPDAKTLNTTGIANIAYLAVKHRNPLIRDVALYKLKELRIQEYENKNAAEFQKAVNKLINTAD